MRSLTFDIYGHFTLEITREEGLWKPFRLGEGKRRPVRDLVIPSDLLECELLGYLDDVYHEFARPGAEIRPIRG